MSADYTVRLTSAIPDEDQALTALRVADELEISAATLLRLFVRGAGDMTRPIPKAQAERIVGALRRAGVSAEVARADLNDLDDDLPRIVLPAAEVAEAEDEDAAILLEPSDPATPPDKTEPVGAEVSLVPEPVTVSAPEHEGVQVETEQRSNDRALEPEPLTVKGQVEASEAVEREADKAKPNIKITHKPLAGTLPTQADPAPGLRERLLASAAARQQRQEAPVPVRPQRRPARILGLSLLGLLVAAVAVLLFSPSLREPLLARLLPSAEARFASGMEAYTLGDYESARDSWQRLADNGYADAQYQLAWLYNNGLGTERNPAAAARLLEAAAESGHLDAQFDIGSFYQEGTGVNQNDRRALSWFEQAAEAGHIEAQNQLALHYFEGRGVAQDLEEAARLFEDAAEQGSPRAMFNIGVLYAGAQGVTRDFDQAESWLQRAADAGVSEALPFLEVVAANKAALATAEADGDLTEFNIFRLARFGSADGVIRAVIGGEDISVADSDGQTLLMYAAGANDADVVRELLSGGAEVNMQNKSGWTALMFAARDNPNPEIIETLLEAGADPSLTNSAGETVRDIAARHNPEILGLFGSSVQSAN